MRTSFFGAALTAAVLFCGVASAGEPDAADVAFRRGIALMESGAVNEACIAFEQSERLDSKAGTLLNLAGCYEKASRWEDAYRTFESARESARARQRADWEAIATEHLAVLRPKLSLVTVDATETSAVPGARLTIDGRTVRADELARGIALGPGPHVVRTEAAGYRASEQLITTPPDARVKLPRLERDPASTSDATQRSRAVRDDSRGRTRRTAGLVVGATGAAALAFGTVSGIVASGAASDAKAACSSYPDHCSPSAAEPNDRAMTWSTISTIALLSGGALVAVGVTLYLWPTSRAPTTAKIVVTGSGVGMGLTF